jgi:hypothetical protein
LRIKNCLLLVKNHWHLQTANILQLAALGCDYAKLLDEFIDFKNDTNLEVIFKEKRGKGVRRILEISARKIQHGTKMCSPVAYLINISLRIILFKNEICEECIQGVFEVEVFLLTCDSMRCSKEF